MPPAGGNRYGIGPWRYATGFQTRGNRRDMNGLDWVMVGVGLFCGARGIMRGAVSQIFGIAGLLSGFILASHYYEPLAGRLAQVFPQLSGTQVISFVLVFFLTWFCVAVVGFWIAKLLRKAGLGFLDRLWGGMIGLGKALIFSVVAISVLTLFVSPQNPLLTRSALAPYIQEAARVLVQVTPVNVQKAFEEKRKALERYWLDSQKNPDKSDRAEKTGERKNK